MSDALSIIDFSRMDAIGLLNIIVEDVAYVIMTRHDTVFHIVGVNAGALG